MDFDAVLLVSYDFSNSQKLGKALQASAFAWQQSRPRCLQAKALWQIRFCGALDSGCTIGCVCHAARESIFCHAEVAAGDSIVYARPSLALLGSVMCGN